MIFDCIISQKRRRKIYQYKNHHIIDHQVIILYQNDNIHEIDQEK